MITNLNSICNATLLNNTEQSLYGCFLLNDPTSTVSTTISILIILYGLLALWSLWELSFQCYRSNTLCASLFSRTTWICLMSFTTGLMFLVFYAVKKNAYDDKRMYETFRGLADMSGFTLCMFVCHAWIDMATSLIKYSAAGQQGPKYTYFHQILQQCGWINVCYVVFRALEIVFRIPPPYGLRNLTSAATVCRAVALAAYGVIMVCIVSVTYTTYMKLRGLVAKRKAGDLLKRKVVQMTFFIIVSTLCGFTMGLMWLLREQTFKKMYNKDLNTLDNWEGYYASSLPFEFAEFFFILFLWVPSTLENAPGWCHNWCRKEHWFYCCYKEHLKEDHSKVHHTSGASSGLPNEELNSRRSEIATLQQNSSAKKKNLRSLHSRLESVTNLKKMIEQEVEHGGDLGGETPALSSSGDPLLKKLKRESSVNLFRSVKDGSGNINQDELQAHMNTNSSQQKKKRISYLLDHDKHDPTVLAGRAAIKMGSGGGGSSSSIVKQRNSFAKRGTVVGAATAGEIPMVPMESKEELGTPTTVLSFLKTVTMFSHLEDVQFERLVECVDLVEYKKGTVIIRQGEVGKQMFMIQKGSVYASVTKTTSNEPPQPEPPQQSSEQQQANKNGAEQPAMSLKTLSTLAKGNNDSHSVMGAPSEYDCVLCGFQGLSNVDLNQHCKFVKDDRQAMLNGYAVEIQTKNTDTGFIHRHPVYLYSSDDYQSLCWCNGTSVLDKHDLDNVSKTGVSLPMLSIQSVSQNERTCSLVVKIKLSQAIQLKMQSFEIYFPKPNQGGNQGEEEVDTKVFLTPLYQSFKRFLNFGHQHREEDPMETRAEEIRKSSPQKNQNSSSTDTATDLIYRKKSLPDSFRLEIKLDGVVSLLLLWVVVVGCCWLVGGWCWLVGRCCCWLLLPMMLPMMLPMRRLTVPPITHRVHRVHYVHYVHTAFTVSRCRPKWGKEKCLGNWPFSVDVLEGLRARR